MQEQALALVVKILYLSFEPLSVIYKTCLEFNKEYHKFIFNQLFEYSLYDI